MSERVIERPACRREPRLRHPAREARHLLRVIVPLLGVTLVLVGCQSQGSSNNGERRDGFYGGVTGGFNRP